MNLGCQSTLVHVNGPKFLPGYRPLQIMLAFFEHFGDRWAFEHNASIMVELF